MKVLFISYDGILDPLGQSQILPYIRKISASLHPIHILSFEKGAHWDCPTEPVPRQLEAEGIGWTPLSFTAALGRFGKAHDLARMHAAAIALQRRHQFDLIHCRSYQAMQVGLLLKRLFGVKLIFDMRGLWVDDRVEGGLWPQDKTFYRHLYRAYKTLERRMLARADHLVTLSHNSIPVLRSIHPLSAERITVIPCCADFEHFVPLDEAHKCTVRGALGVAPDETVVSYLGSIGTVYLFEDMLRFFRKVLDIHGAARFLIITRDWEEKGERLFSRPEYRALRDRLIVRSASRSEVPSLLGCSDVMLSFRRASFSQIACCPTKLGEAFAMGVPVISNKGVGDVDALTEDVRGGTTVDLEDEADVARAIAALPRIMEESAGLRERARPVLGLEVATERYRAIYAGLERAREDG